MKKSRSKSKQLRKQRIQGEQEEIALLNQWIEAQKPEPNTNPMALPPLPSGSPVGRLPGEGFSRYAGSTQFDELPLSKKTKDGLKKAGYVSMTKIQRASLPHSLCGRDILGAAKTGSGKTLAFVIPVLEKLYKERWSQEDGVGSIIISPTRELAAQLFDVLQAVGKFHNYSAGLFIGGRHDVDAEKERANVLNILVCTPGRLLQHMDETPNFDCSQLQVLVLDEADRILDIGFKKALNAIISQLPKQRQTMLFSATQTKSVQDLARLSLKDPEYVSVIEGSTTPTPKLLQQTVMEVALHEKMDMLWSFIKSHLNSRILVFLTSCKQVKFVFRAFKALHPGIPLKCLHGRMKQEMRMVVYSQFCEGRSVLFSTDVASRGLDFNKAVDWVVQFDCPEDVASYIHRAGRTARYLSGGKSLLFLMPSEMKMLEKLQEANIPIKLIKPNKKKLQPVSPLMSALLVKDEEMRKLAQRAFVTYLRSVHVQKDKEVFDLMKLPIDEFSASLGLPMTPRIRFVKGKLKKKTAFGNSTSLEMDNSRSQNSSGFENPGQVLDTSNLEEDVREKLLPEEESDDEILHARDPVTETKVQAAEIGNTMPPTWVSKKKKLKININRPIGTKIVFDDDEDNSPPTSSSNFSSLLELGNKDEFYRKLREDMKEADKEDKLAERQRLRDKRTKAKSKRKKGMEESEDELSGSEEEDDGGRKRQKVAYSDIDNDEDEMEGSRDNVGINTKTLSLKEQEAIALKLLESMHK